MTAQGNRTRAAKRRARAVELLNTCDVRALALMLGLPNTSNVVERELREEAHEAFRTGSLSVQAIEGACS
jgi:hypothetical protein